jgi:hypothetical protein
MWNDPQTLPAGSRGATRKYKVWMRHRYNSCCNRLQELLAHPSFQVKVRLGVALPLSIHLQSSPQSRGFLFLGFCA